MSNPGLNDERIARLCIYGVGKMCPNSRAHLADWLRQNADHVEMFSDQYSDKLFTANLMVTKGGTPKIKEISNGDH
jgi:hypothetical protein